MKTTSVGIKDAALQTELNELCRLQCKRDRLTQKDINVYNVVFLLVRLFRIVLLNKRITNASHRANSIAEIFT
jgi:hypothetical protein